jgi:hypothetical protein
MYWVGHIFILKDDSHRHASFLKCFPTGLCMPYTYVLVEQGSAHNASFVEFDFERKRGANIILCD